MHCINYYIIDFARLEILRLTDNIFHFNIDLYKTILNIIRNLFNSLCLLNVYLYFYKLYFIFIYLINYLYFNIKKLRKFYCFRCI